MAGLNLNITIIILNINSMIKSKRWKVKGWEKIHHANTNQKKEGVAVLISDKVDFKAKKITRVRQGHYTMFKRIDHSII